jgi:hypothetical protein
MSMGNWRESFSTTERLHPTVGSIATGIRLCRRLIIIKFDWRNGSAQTLEPNDAIFGVIHINMKVRKVEENALIVRQKATTRQSADMTDG